MTKHSPGMCRALGSSPSTGGKSKIGGRHTVCPITSLSLFCSSVCPASIVGNLREVLVMGGLSRGLDAAEAVAALSGQKLLEPLG